MVRGRDALSPLAAAVIGICMTLVAATFTAHASQVAAEGGGWMAPLELPQSGDGTSTGPQLARQQNGNLHAIWMEKGAMTFSVHHVSSVDQGTNWAYSTPLAPADEERYGPRMHVDEYGAVHTVWVEKPNQYQYQLWYGRLYEDSWDVPEEPITQTNSALLGPDVVVTPGFVHTVWYAYGPTGYAWDVFYSRSEGGEWSPVTTTVDTVDSSSSPRIAADTLGNLHLVWQENTSPRQIYYISGTVTETEDGERTVWSDPITVSAGLTQNSTTPDISVGPDNRVHVVFSVNVADYQHVQDIYYATFPVTDTGGISATLIPQSRVTITQLLPTYASPSLALVGTDEVHVAWNGMMGEDYADRIYYALSRDAGLTWSRPTAASPRDVWPDGFPSLVADEEFAYLVWQEKVSPSDQDIYYSRRLPARLRFPLAAKAD